MLLACNDEQCRYALGGVLVERDAEGKPHAVATDGRRLHHVTWVEDDAAAMPGLGLDIRPRPGLAEILPAAAWKAAAKLPMPKRTPKPILQNVLLEESTANGQVKLAATDLERSETQVVRSVEGRFPAWRDVLPERVVLSPEQQERLADQYDWAAYRAACDAATAAATKDAPYIPPTLEPQAEPLKRSYNGAAEGTLYVRIRLDPRSVRDTLAFLERVGTSEDSRGVDLYVPLSAGSAVEFRAAVDGREARAIVMPLARDR
jgi:hypothetical protein